MATPVIFNGVNYSVPAYNDTGYAQGPGNLSSYLIAIASGTLQQSGGTFSLAADVNFGLNFGLLSKYFTSITANPATAGVVRLAKTDSIDWRNNANSANLALAINGSDQLTYNGAIVQTGTGFVTSITGTPHQVIASASTGAVTLSTPQNIDTTSPVIFNSVTVAGASNGISSAAGDLLLNAASGVKLSSFGGGAVIVDTANIQPTSSGSASVGNSALPFSAVYTKGALHLQETGAGTAEIDLIAPSAVTSYTLTLPTAVGTTGQTLITTDNVGTLGWTTPRTGTVTSVALTVPSFLSVSGSPITTSGTLGVTLSGTALPVLNGGTNSSTSLTNGLVMVSSGGRVVEVSSDTSMGSNKITSLKDPTSAQDAATKNYVDNLVNGLGYKDPANYATTTTLPAYVYVSGVITMTSTGTVTVDGHTLALNDRILVKNETSTNQPYNGIYNVTTAGALGVACVLTRSSDYNTSAEIIAGTLVPVQFGTVNADTLWIQTINSVTVGVTNVVFQQYGVSGSGTVNSGTATHLAYYATSTNAVSDANGTTVSGAYTFSGVHTYSAGAGAITMSGSTIAMGSNKITGLANGTTSGDALAFGQSFTAGNITFSPTTSGIVGTTTNNNATAGNVGEYIESVVTGVNCGTTAQWNDLTSISLTAGDWDVTLVAGMNAVGAFTAFSAGISKAGVSGNSFSDAVDASNSISTTDNISFPNRDYITIPVYRISLASTTTIYAKQQTTYSGSIPAGRGRLSARRVR